jgi:carbamoyltransferase
VNILGINCFSRDTSACLLSDGKIAAFVEEERFNRVKHTKRFPSRSIDYCLQAAGLDIRDIDMVGIAHQPGVDFFRAMDDALRRLPRSWRRLFVQPAVDANLYLRKPIFRLSKGFVGPAMFVSHHDAHAAAAFFASPFQEAAVMSIDRAGNHHSTWLGRGWGNEMKAIGTVGQPHSLGEVYAAATDYLGFNPNCDEDKVMGLAPYGSHAYHERFRRLIALKDQGRFEVDLSYFAYHLKSGWYSDKFVELFGPKRLLGEEIGTRHQDIAAAVQETAEKTALHLADHLAKTVRSRNICLGGGMALNSRLSSAILRGGSFEEIFIQPAAGDAGNALGAAYYLYHVVLGRPKVEPMSHAYLGPEYEPRQIIGALRSARLRYTTPRNVESYCADRLAEGEIVGWFQGRAEVGPRALGNRSILANPTLAATKEIVNGKIRRRESFQSLSAAVQAERAADYVENCYPSPYMQLTLEIKEQRRAAVPSITGVDGTASLQTVEQRTNPRLWELIERFRGKTGVPMVASTSMCLQGEPAALTPDDAVRTFQTSNMDCLVMGDYVVEKS